MTTNVANQSLSSNNILKAIDSIVELKSKESSIDKTAKKINYFALLGIAFLTIGIVATIIGTLCFNAFIIASIATTETLLGIGSISLVLGSLSISKPLSEKHKKFDPRKYALVGIKNRNNNCWLNSLMQMLLNSPNVKKILLQNTNFKKFIEKYEKASKENKKINAQTLKLFLRELCPAIPEEDSDAFDSQEVLLAILDFFRDSNSDLQNFVTSTVHFSHSNGNQSSVPETNPENGCISLAPLEATSKNDSLITRIKNYFYSEEFSEETNDVQTVQTTIVERYCCGLRKIVTEVEEERVVGTKRKVLEERKFRFAPKDLFFHISRLSDELNSVAVPLRLKIDKTHFENNLDASYELDSFICHISASHYIAYVKRKGHWFICDDTRVKRVSLENAADASKKSSLVHYKKLG